MSPICRSRVFRTSSLVALLSWATWSRSFAQDTLLNLTLDEAIAAALVNNAELRAIRSRYEAMRERPAQKRTLPNPMFTYGSMDRLDGGTWPNTSEKRFMFEQEFPWFGKSGLRGKIATKEAEAMQREYEAMRRELIMMVKENYFDLYAVQRALSFIRTEEGVLKRMQQIAETEYATGTVSQQDVLKAQAEITMLQQKLLELEQQQSVLHAKLNQLMNRRADSLLGTAVTPPADTVDSGAEQLFESAENNRPEIQGAQAQIERSHYERSLMKKEYLPDFRIGAEYRSFAGEDPDMFMVSLGLDLPIWRSKYNAGVREAEKMIESSTAALEATQKQTSYDVQDAHFKLLTARRTVALYREVLIPQAEARFAASEAGYRTGRVSFLDLLESERFLLDARVMYAMAEGNLGMQLARLERAVGIDSRPEIHQE